MALSTLFVATGYSQSTNTGTSTTPVHKEEVKKGNEKSATAEKAGSNSGNANGHNEVIMEKPNVAPARPVGSANNNNNAAPHNGAETLENSAPPK